LAGDSTITSDFFDADLVEVFFVVFEVFFVVFEVFFVVFEVFFVVFFVAILFVLRTSVTPGGGDVRSDVRSDVRPDARVGTTSY
jgi:hypothetical protein